MPAERDANIVSERRKNCSQTRQPKYHRSVSYVFCFCSEDQTCNLSLNSVQYPKLGNSCIFLNTVHVPHNYNFSQYFARNNVENDDKNLGCLDYLRMIIT